MLKNKKYVALFSAPAFILISVFLYYPLYKTFTYSTMYYKNWVTSEMRFVGMDNYKEMLHDYVIKKALSNTLILMIACLLFEVGIALIIALLLDSIKRGFKFFRTVYFFPVVISGSAIGLMFYLAFQYQYGLVNGILQVFGKERVDFITEKTSLMLVSIPTIWQYIGFYMVIFLTAIAAIPTDIYESAMIDGINGIKKAIYITVPLIRDVLVTVTFLVISGVLKVFDIVYVMTQGGPMDSSQLLGTYIRDVAFQYMNQGYASAIAVLMIVIGIVLYLISTLAERKETLTY